MAARRHGLLMKRGHDVDRSPGLEQAPAVRRDRPRDAGSGRDRVAGTASSRAGSANGRRPPTRAFQAHLGWLVHRAVAACLIRARDARSDPLAMRDAIVLEVLAADPLRADRRRGLLLLGSLTRAYLRDFAWPPLWELIAVERVTVSGRRTDLLFMHAETGELVADELKTASASVGYVSTAEVEQVSAYLADLRQEYGKGFLGVRLVHLGPPAHARLFTTKNEVRMAAVQGLE